jgi:osmotically-inducible protein OsmY
MGTLLRVLLLAGILTIVFFMLPSDDETAASARQRAEQKLGAVAERAKHAVSDLDADAVAKELRETGRVVRRNSAQAVHSLAAATEDIRTSAAIEAQYVADPRLSALAISVNTTDGIVTIAGRVDSAADVAHAVELALRHDNVREVISTLQVGRPKAAQAPPAPLQATPPPL